VSPNSKSPPYKPCILVELQSNGCHAKQENDHKALIKKNTIFLTINKRITLKLQY